MNIIDAINTLYLRAVELDNYAERKEMFEILNTIHEKIVYPDTTAWVDVEYAADEDLYYIFGYSPLSEDCLDHTTTLSSAVGICNSRGWAIRSITP